MKSRSIAQQIVGNNTIEDRIKQRCVIATGDPKFKDLLQFKNNPIENGIACIRDESTIYTDINMVKVGISRKREVKCVLDSSRCIAELTKKYGITRTSAGFIALYKENKLQDSIIVIGNSPSAAITVYNLVKKGINPRLIIATPVGFVNAAKSKALIRTLNVPSITCTGTRGGTPVAVAIINELITLAISQHSAIINHQSAIE